MRSAFSMFVHQTIERIEERVVGAGSHNARHSLRRELLRYLVLRERPHELLERGVIKLTELKTHGQRADQVALAMHARARHKATIGQAAKLTDAGEHDLRIVDELAKTLNVSLLVLDVEAPVEVQGGVSAYYEKLVVRVDQRAVEDLLLAALESYRVPKPGKGQKYTEAYGYCFGTTRIVPVGDKHHRNERRINVARIVTQLRNHSSASHVVPNNKSEQLHLEVAERFFSHLDLVGDYHTHPYKSLSHLKSSQGWRFSGSDETAMAHWVDAHTHGTTRPCFSLIAAVADGGRSGKTVSREKSNRVRYCVDGTFVVLVAYRFGVSGDYSQGLELRVPGAE